MAERLNPERENPPPFHFPGATMKRMRIGVAVLLVNKMLKVTVYVVPLTIGKAPYDVVVACMN